MPKVYEVDISNKNINDLLDVDGDVSANKFLDLAPDGAVKSIDYLLDVYDRSAFVRFYDIFRGQGAALAWAYIFLDREYAVSDVVRDTLGDNGGIRFENYSCLSNPQFPNERHSIGYIWIKDKTDLARLSDKSVLWAECWRVLADADADKHYISIFDPLPKDWSYQNENSNVLNMWHEVKAHSFSGRKSHDQH
jgi:hypothetical protein